MKAFMFPGQGSQARGMGGDLFDEFKSMTETADKVLGYSIKELCLDDPRKELNKTQFTQPALYVVNALNYFNKVEKSGAKPDFLIGHSLGEFNALLAAECFDFEAGLKLVRKRGELMSQTTDGGMAAILNATKEQVVAILEENGLTTIDLANYNTPYQVVVSGPRDEIASAQSLFQKDDMLYYPLNTSGAFHSRYMQPAREKFEAYLKKFKFSDLKVPVISNVSAKPYENGEILENLSKQIVSSVKWSDSIQYLMGLRGGKANGHADSMEFEEIGNGDVLAKLVDKIRDETPRYLAVLGQADEAEGFFGEASEHTDEVESDVTGATEVNENSSDAEKKVRDWNNAYAIGTKVKSSHPYDDDLETRTEAVVLFGHRAAVYMKGYNGYFDLDEITPL